MIPIIGVMIGLYIITRMIEVIVGNARTLLKVLAGITAVGNAIGIAALLNNSGSISSTLGSGDDASPGTIHSAMLDSLSSSSSSDPTWTLNQSTNPIDDFPTVVLSLDAASGASRMGERPTLVLRCTQKKTNVYVNLERFPRIRGNPSYDANRKNRSTNT